MPSLVIDTCQVPLKPFTADMPRYKATLLTRGVVVLAKHYCRIRKCIAPTFTCAEVRPHETVHEMTRGIYFSRPIIPKLMTRVKHRFATTWWHI